VQSKHEIENVQSAGVIPLNRQAQPASSTLPKLPHARRTSHPEFPLERLCSHLHEPFQLTFARSAQQHFRVREDVEVVASHKGLAIGGESEDAIDAAIVILKDLYGPNLRIGPPTIRYHKGVSLEQPWMGLSLRCTPKYFDAVNADLHVREATVSSCDFGPEQCLIQASAPLAALLGYRADLEDLTAGSARHAMWLSHYEPIETPPPDGQAA
jgi:hypothetical protein